MSAPYKLQSKNNSISLWYGINMCCKICIVISSLFFMTACGRSEPTSFYLLESKTLSPTHSYLAKNKRKMPKIVLQEVVIPAYLERAAIVNRQSDGVRVDISEFNSWAEDLDDGISRTLSAVLLDELLKQNILLVPVNSDNDNASKLFVFLQRFDGQIGGQVVIDARWVLQNSNSEALASGSFSEKSAAGANFGSMVVAQSALLEKFAKHMPESIVRAIRGR